LRSELLTYNYDFKTALLNIIYGSVVFGTPDNMWHDDHASFVSTPHVTGTLVSILNYSKEDNENSNI